MTDTKRLFELRCTRRDLALIALVGVGIRAILIGITGTWGEPHLWEYDIIARNMLA